MQKTLLSVIAFCDTPWILCECLLGVSVISLRQENHLKFKLRNKAVTVDRKVTLWINTIPNCEKISRINDLGPFVQWIQNSFSQFGSKRWYLKHPILWFYFDIKMRLISRLNLRLLWMGLLCLLLNACYTRNNYYLISYKTKKIKQNKNTNTKKKNRKNLIGYCLYILDNLRDTWNYRLTCLY